MLSGGIDSAIIASYLPKKTVCVTWAGWGSETTDWLYARQTFRHLRLREHLRVDIDYIKDKMIFSQALKRILLPFSFGAGVPFLRMSYALREYFGGNYQLFIGQNADTIAGSFRPTIFSYYFSKVSFLTKWFVKAGIINRKRKMFLLSSTNPVELIAFFHSCGLYPGSWINIPKEYFAKKLQNIERQIGRKPREFKDFILMEELMTESRRNQLVQNYLPAIFDADVKLPYYDKEIVKLFLQVPHRIRRKENFGKIILKELAKKRGLPAEIIEKGKKGLSYGYRDFIRSGHHIPIWNLMEKDILLNDFINIKKVRKKFQDNFATFDLLRSLQAYLSSLRIV